MSARESVIGMLDWGVGGLGCYRALRESHPDLNVLYCSDTGAVPYGKLSPRALRERVEQRLAQLIGLGATHLMVACNAASTVLAELSLPVAVLGMVECGMAVVPAAFTGCLGIVGGRRTVESELYQRALGGPTRRIVARIAQPLSAHIEAGSTDSAVFAAELAEIMAPLADADAILLACTHYPAVAPQIAAHVPRAQLLDPTRALSALVSERWQLHSARPSTRLFCTGDPDAMQRAAQRVWGVDAGSVTFLRT